jgi:copper chaperone
LGTTRHLYRGILGRKRLEAKGLGAKRLGAKEPIMSETVTLSVKGMSCEGCANAVKKIVARNAPQAETQIDLASGLVRIAGASDAAVLAAAITKGGYPATLAG